MRWTVLLMALLLGCEVDYSNPERENLESELDSLIAVNGGKSSMMIPGRLSYDLLEWEGNPINYDKVLLGQWAFFDPSLNDTRVKASATAACASCHDPELQGAAGIVQSLGEGGRGIGVDRYPDPYYLMHHPDSIDAPPVQSPSFLNLVFQTSTLWDASVGNDSLPAPEAQALVATDSVHHRHTPPTSFCENEEVKDLLMRAFRDDSCTREQIAFAIAAFERIATTSETKFQDYLRGLTFVETRREQMSLREVRGAITFFDSGCFGCHQTPAFGGDGTATFDLGFPDLVSAHGLNEKDVEAVKPPMLYNLKDEKLYGHGGNYTDLSSVILAHNLEVIGSVDDLVTFLEVSLHDKSVTDLIPDRVPSGTCVGQRDLVTKRETGCQ